MTMSIVIQPPGAMMPQGPMQRPQYHPGAPGPVSAYPQAVDTRPGPGWPDPRHPISGDGMHPGVMPPVPGRGEFQIS